MRARSLSQRCKAKTNDRALRWWRRKAIAVTAGIVAVVVIAVSAILVTVNTENVSAQRVSASATSRQSVVPACQSFATSSKDAIDKVNDFVAAFNQGRDTPPSEASAIEALNHSADVVAGAVSDALSPELRNALNAYSDAARDVADAIRSHAGTAEFNQRVNQLNDTQTKAVGLCQPS